MPPEITPSKRTPLTTAPQPIAVHRPATNANADPLLEPGETELELPAKTATAVPRRPVIAPISPKSELQPEAEQTPSRPEAAQVVPSDEAASLDIQPDPALGAQKVAQQNSEHEQQVQDHINGRTYFLPINTAARKRSLLVSAGMTMCVILLGLVLIDLMLDSGIILLLQKIPHTHFFDTGS